jgi:HAD superfamily phosphatase (TIGR01668 family)
MKTWKTGEFDHARVGRGFRKFTPAEAVHGLRDVDLDRLKERGKKLILLDVDHTLVEWKGEAPAPGVSEWLTKAKEMGFQLCLISNTRRPERLMRLSESLNIAVVRGRMKPSRAMFRLALLKFQCAPSEAIMIGDQLVTDIFGANRSGIDAIWVEKMEGPEFKGTAVNRAIEGFLKTQIYKALILGKEGTGGPEVQERTLLKQLSRFVVVGGTSFVIDYVVKLIIMRFTVLGLAIGGTLQGTFVQEVIRSSEPLKLASPVAGLIAWSIATVNSLIFNRSWTFEAVGKAPRATQIKKFFLVTTIAALLNISLFTFFYRIIPGESVFTSHVLSAGIVAVWNFLGQRYFAFRAPTE